MAKQKEGKPRMGLVYASAMEEIAKVREYGINKYGDRGDWRTVPREDYFDAALRHLIKAKAYEFDECSAENDIDEESGISHLSHAMVNIMFLIEGRTKKERSSR